MNPGMLSLNTWIENNAGKLVRQLCAAGPLNEDAYQDAYLTLVATSGRHACDGSFEQAFIAAYRNCCRKQLSEAFATVNPDETFFERQAAYAGGDSAEHNRQQPAKEHLAVVIRAHILTTYSTTEAEAWKMRMAGNSIRDIADALGISKDIAKRTLHKIAHQVRSRFASAISNCQAQ